MANETRVIHDLFQVGACYIGCVTPTSSENAQKCVELGIFADL